MTAKFVATAFSGWKSHLLQRGTGEDWELHFGDAESKMSVSLPAGVSTGQWDVQGCCYPIL